MINTATTIIPLKTLVGDLYGEESPRSSEFCSVFPLTKSARCDLIITEKERREEKRREEKKKKKVMFLIGVLRSLNDRTPRFFPCSLCL